MRAAKAAETGNGTKKMKTKVYPRPLVARVRAAIKQGAYIEAAMMVIRAGSRMCFFCQKAEGAKPNNQKLAVVCDSRFDIVTRARLCSDCFVDRIWNDQRLNDSLADQVQTSAASRAAALKAAYRIDLNVQVDSRIVAIVTPDITDTQTEIEQAALATPEVYNAVAGREYTVRLFAKRLLIKTKDRRSQ